MGVFDNDLILPGASTELISDFSFGYDQGLFGTTDSVTIIGTAFNGPTGKPVAIQSPEHAAYVFGEAYDYKTRREATLVAEIKDAWERGCRTIYAIRISGKEIYKDFSLIPETKLKLRVSGLFPSNSNKDIYMVYDNTVGAECVKVYKPAKRATIQERREGAVDKQESILVAKIDIAGSFGLTRDDRLVELIKVVNDYYRNNVIKLSIVDENGADVTIASKEAQALSIGALFPGAYFIGRDVSKCIVQTDVEYVLADESKKPYENFDGVIFRNLKLNTDINSSFPIYAEEMSELNKFFDGKIIMSKMWDFLEIYNKADEIFAKDKNDYEEVELSNFDVYKRLGSGFATTAKVETAVRNVDGQQKTVIKRVIETPVSDPNRVTPIHDGIYSMLESLRSDYRVLSNGVSDTKIEGKLPKKSEFEIKTAIENNIKGLIRVTPIVEKTDKVGARSYKFTVKRNETLVDAATVKAGLFNKTVVMASMFDTVEAANAAGLPEGTNVFIGTATSMEHLKTAYTIEKFGRITLGQFEEAKIPTTSTRFFYCNGVVLKVTASEKVQASSTDFQGKTYILVDSEESIFVHELVASDLSVIESTKVIGPVEKVLSEEKDKTLITVPAAFNTENEIVIESNEFDYITLEELVQILNEDKNLGKRFAFALTSAAIAEKDSVVEDAFGFVNEEGEVQTETFTSDAKADKEDGIDTQLYIPYKTSDNFARHLAQHCQYTSLKTAPTHGIIGCSKLMDVNYTSIAKKVDSLLALELNLYAKKDNGVDMLDQNNLPYPIGHLVSVVFGQYTVATLDGHTYMSNGAGGYAGMVSVLPIDQSSTNQPIKLSTLMFELTNYQLEKLTQKGFVTFKQSYTKGLVVTDGVTMGTSASPFRRLSTARITNTVEELIREATEPFIGQQNHLANRNSMQTAIKSKLDSIKGRLIQAYEFRLVNNTASEEMGVVDIEYRMIPVYEIREIRNRITVTNKL